MAKKFEEALRSGSDIYYAQECIEDQPELIKAYSEYILDLIVAQHRRVVKNNQEIALKTANVDNPLQKDVLAGEQEDWRDQGFTRPTVLILTTFKNQAADIVKCLESSWKARGNGRQVDGMARFQREFIGLPDQDSPEANVNDGEEYPGNIDPKRSEKVIISRGAAYEWQFRGNVDDSFRIGVKFTRKAMRLFSEFYSADLIIASPLGLRLVIDGTERLVIHSGEGNNKRKKRKKQPGDCDFLSSITCCVVDQMDMIGMQNWEHLEKVFEHVNKIPKESHDCDFSRVKMAFLDGNGQSLRQTVLLSAFEFVEANALWSQHSRPQKSLKFSQTNETLSSGIEIPFYPFAWPVIHEVPQRRLEHFKNNILPLIKRSKSGTAIFVSSYFDFCILMDFLQQQTTTICQPLNSLSHLSEYSTVQDISRARTAFFNGSCKLLVFTERFYFFKRYRLRGIQSLHFYQPPMYPAYLPEMLSWIGDCKPKNTNTDDDNGSKCTMLVEGTQDYLALMRIFGPDAVHDIFAS